MVSGVFSIPLGHALAAKSATNRGRGPRSPLREYIGGVENALVRQAAEILLDSPEPYNPLVLVGPTGVGKTHLAHGLAECWKFDHPDRRVIITTGADFAREYAAEVETDTLAYLRERYFATDLLLIDDVQELSGKRAAQQELQYLLDRLQADKRQVLVTARQMPCELPHFSEGLASRLAGGLCVPLVAPGVHARRVILLKLADLHETSLDERALFLLAERLAGTVPMLNHAILELDRARGRKPEIDTATVDQFLATPSANSASVVRNIIRVVARFFRLTKSDLTGPSRRTTAVRARSVAMYLSRQLTSESLEQVGRTFGGRDHTTVRHACRKIESLVETDDDTKYVVDGLLQKVEGLVKN